ncbi:MAG TPA: SIMPL domain-containing protein [Micromonosporaceae bacterium]|jgi:uncharacterized protein YggE|nr:SIMPL domain-containing protein [Micromonosporaceae bacterium]
MSDAPVVAVRGEVVREVPPEIARFSVTVSARDKDRQATLHRLTQRAEAIRALLDGYGDAIERRETGGLVVGPELKRSGERVSAYHGSVQTTVTVADFTALGELLLRLADQDQTTVYGPWWELRPASPVYREARRAAIGDAVTRAAEYAEAVGARLGRLLEIADVGLSAQPVAKRGFAVSLGGMRAMAAESAAPELELEPQQQTVQASVEARFTITEPTKLTDPID